MLSDSRIVQKNAYVFVEIALQHNDGHLWRPEGGFQSARVKSLLLESCVRCFELPLQCMSCTEALLLCENPFFTILRRTISKYIHFASVLKHPTLLCQDHQRWVMRQLYFFFFHLYVSQNKIYSFSNPSYNHLYLLFQPLKVACFSIVP
jgi:hypothetical protein